MAPFGKKRNTIMWRLLCACEPMKPALQWWSGKKGRAYIVNLCSDRN